MKIIHFPDWVFNHRVKISIYLLSAITLNYIFWFNLIYILKLNKNMYIYLHIDVWLLPSVYHTTNSAYKDKSNRKNFRYVYKFLCVVYDICTYVYVTGTIYLVETYVHTILKKILPIWNFIYWIMNNNFRCGISVCLQFVEFWNTVKLL